MCGHVDTAAARGSTREGTFNFATHLGSSAKMGATALSSSSPSSCYFYIPNIQPDDIHQREDLWTSSNPKAPPQPWLGKVLKSKS